MISKNLLLGDVFLYCIFSLLFVSLVCLILYAFRIILFEIVINHSNLRFLLSVVSFE